MSGDRIWDNENENDDIEDRQDDSKDDEFQDVEKAESPGQPLPPVPAENTPKSVPSQQGQQGATSAPNVTPMNLDSVNAAIGAATCVSIATPVDAAGALKTVQTVVILRACQAFVALLSFSITAGRLNDITFKELFELGGLRWLVAVGVFAFIGGTALAILGGMVLKGKGQMAPFAQAGIVYEILFMFLWLSAFSASASNPFSSGIANFFAFCLFICHALSLRLSKGLYDAIGLLP